MPSQDPIALPEASTANTDRARKRSGLKDVVLALVIAMTGGLASGLLVVYVQVSAQSKADAFEKRLVALTQFSSDFNRYTNDRMRSTGHYENILRMFAEDIKDGRIDDPLLYKYHEDYVKLAERLQDRVDFAVQSHYLALHSLGLLEAPPRVGYTEVPEHAKICVLSISTVLEKYEQPPFHVPRLLECAKTLIAFSEKFRKDLTEERDRVNSLLAEASRTARSAAGYDR